MSAARPSAAMLLALAASCSGGGGSRPPAAAEAPGYLGPEIAVDSPPRGAMLAQGGAATGAVPLSGQACDAAHALAALQVGGASLPVSAGRCQAFQVSQPSRWGLTVVEGTAVNDAGQTGTLAQSFLRSPTWFSADPADPASRAPSGAVLLLGPAFVDDGDRATPDDLATLAEIELASFDVDAAVGSPQLASPDANGDGVIDTVAHDCLFWTQRNWATGYEAWKDGPATRGPITVDQLRLVDGGIAARATVHSLAVPLAVLGNVDLGCAGAARKTVTGDARADSLVLEGTAEVGLDASGAPSVAFGSLTATLDGLQLDIDLGAIGDWTGLGSAVGDALAAEVRGPVQQAIAEAVRGALGAPLSGALAALGSLRAAATLPPLLGGTALAIDSGIDHLELTPAGVVLGASVRVRPAAPVPEHLAAASFGAMALGSALPAAASLGGAALGLGVSDDALSQLLHAAWLGGAFDAADLGSRLDLGIPGAHLAVFSLLPPVLMPRQDGAPGVDVGWGDLAFDLTLPAPGGSAVEVRGWLSAVASVDGLEVAPGGGRFGPAFAPGPRVWVQVAEVNWGDGPATRLAVESLLRTAAASFLPSILAGAVAAFPLPSLDLRSLDPALPPLALSLPDPRLAREGNYELMAGSVAAAP